MNITNHLKRLQLIWSLENYEPLDQDNGVWKKRLKLNSGKYHYRFVIDGTWIDDANNPDREINPYGTMDSLIEVKKKV